FVCDFIPISPRRFPHQILSTRPPPRPPQVDRPRHVSFRIPVLDSEVRASARLWTRRSAFLQDLGHMTNHFLYQVRNLLEIGIGPIRLQHGELGIVLPRNSLVPEIAIEFENFIESAH